ncbi:hypothetical protein SALBM311S_02943 [Streptomyces alboniger]
MDRQHSLDRVERAGEDGEGAVRHTVGVQAGACELRQPRFDGDASVEDRLPVPLRAGRRERLRQGRQQRRVRVAVGHVPHARRGVHPDVLTPGRGRTGSHPAASAPGGLDDSAFAQDAVGGRDGVRIHPQLRRQLPHGRQKLTRLQLSVPHRTLDARRNIRRTSTFDPIFS